MGVEDKFQVLRGKGRDGRALKVKAGDIDRWKAIRN